MDNQQVRQDKLSLFSVPETEHYFVDARGLIYSSKKARKGLTQLSSYKHWGRSKNPYLRVKLGGRLWLVHRVVASAMLGRVLTNNEVVNHIDGNTLNNCFNNLEVTTQRENVNHATHNKLYCSGDAWYQARGLTKSL